MCFFAQYYSDLLNFMYTTGIKTMIKVSMQYQMANQNIK